ncbi:MAG: alpha/beta hydrolase [Pseudomonadota bacterium]
MAHRIEFQVDGTRVVGELHVPAGDGPFPAVITGGPMTSVKEQVTGTYAAAMAERGFAALAIDHRHYGESGGEPRQYEYHVHKIEDLIAAVDVLSEQDGVDSDRLGAVGICLGSGYLAHAIQGLPSVKGFVAVAGYYRDVPAIRKADPTWFAARVSEGVAARHTYERTGVVDTIPAAALDGDAAMDLQSTYDYYTDRAAHPNYVNAFAVMSREPFLQFDVQRAAPGLTQPFLMVHSDNALHPDWADAFYRAVPGEKARHRIESEGQTDIYDDPRIVSDVADRVAAFLGRVL